MFPAESDSIYPDAFEWTAAVLHSIRSCQDHALERNELAELQSCNLQTATHSKSGE